MISYKNDREENLTREPEREIAVGRQQAAAAGPLARAVLTRRRVVDYCRVTAAL